MILDNKFYKIDSLTLMAGAPIAVEEYNLIINQPKIADIALIGEKKFFESISIFKLEKDTFLKLVIKGKSAEETVQITNLFYDKTDDQIILFLLFNDSELQKSINNLFSFLFKDIEETTFYEDCIYIKFNDGQQSIINSDSFYIIKDIINQIFSLESEVSGKYNPAPGAAEMIVKKLKEREKKIQQMKNESDSESKPMLANYLLILSIGSNNFSMDNLLNMTLYQLFAIMKKYSLYEQYQMQVKALMAGASDIELIDWMQQN